MKAGKAEAHAAALQANIETVLEAIRSHGGSLKFAPKVGLITLSPLLVNNQLSKLVLITSLAV